MLSHDQVCLPGFRRAGPRSLETRNRAAKHGITNHGITGDGKPKVPICLSTALTATRV